MALRGFFVLGGLVLLALPLFAAQPIYDTAVLYPVGQAPTGIVSVDLNNDGFPDLATVDSASNTVSVLLNAAQEGFLPAVSYPVETGPVSIAAGDLNGDNAADLVVANLTSNTLSILWNAHNGTFPSSTQIPDGSGPRAVAVGQLNDGGLDIVVGHETSQDFRVYHGNNDGTFVMAAEYYIDDPVTAICLLQYSGDSFLDILVSDIGNVAYVYKNNQAGEFALQRKLGCAADAWDAAAGDFDND
ncbi:MAG: VCBS repeat-containing protein, partial [Candidatus Zixiibacteriota bacterium]